MKRKKCAVTALLIIFTLTLASCGKNEPAASETTIKLGADGAVVYPISTGAETKLKYWVSLEAHATKFISNMSETDIAQELARKTGVKIEYVHPPDGVDNVRQAFNIMVASKDLPDMIEYNVNNLYPGGPEKALKDGIIIPLNDIAGTYSPDMLRLLEEKPETKKYCTTNDGNLVMYPAEFKDIESLYQGPMIRGDVLKQVGLAVPETIDEWYRALKKMKELGIRYPLSWSEKAPKIKWSALFTGAYDVALGQWQKDAGNTVMFGAALPAYKDFLTELAKWYKEGLIDPEFVSQDRNALRAKIADGKVGAFIETSGAMTNTISGWRAKDPDTDQVIVGAPFPVKNKGGKVRLGGKPIPIKLTNTAVITTACKEPKLAAAWLNFGYTDEGAKLYNYGIEGKSYSMVNGKAVAADFIINPPAELTRQTERRNWTVMNGPYKALPDFIPEESAAVPEFIEARKNVWVNVSDDNSLRMPELPPSVEDASRYAALYTEIDTYADEMFIKFITGQEPLDNFDKYVKQLETMGLAECAQIQQKVLDGWNKR